MRKNLFLLLSLIPMFLNGQKIFFIPDTSVSGIKLQDSISLKSKIPNILDLIDHNGSGANVYLLNKDESEIVTLSFHSGSNAFVVAEIHIASIGKGSVIKTKTVKLAVDIFITESKIKLHIGKDDFIKIKGENYRLEKNGDTEVLKYVINNFESSVFLQRYNYPVYYANYSFKKGHLTKADFGFEYP